MNKTYHLCVWRVAALYNVRYSDVSRLKAIQNMCYNLSNVVTRSRRQQRVLDLEQEIPADLAKPLYGYAAPTIVFISLVLNTFLIKTLLSKKLRSPTNIILVSVAIVDTLTGLFPLPYYIYAYVFNGYNEYPSTFWCYVFQYGSLLIPTLLHTIALWLTVLLSLQRYIGVINGKCLKCICGYKGLSLAIGGVVFFCCILHSFKLLVYMHPITVVGKKLFDHTGVLHVKTCSRRLSVGIPTDSFNYVYTWIRLTLAEIVPCVLLACFNTLLMRVTYASFSYRRRLVIGNKLAHTTEFWVTFRTSAMLFLIAVSTLLVEVFAAVLVLIKFIQHYHKNHIISQHVLSRCTVVSNFLLIATFPLNFVFCVCLSSAFRRRLSHCLKPGRGRKIAPRRLEPGRQEAQRVVQQTSLISVLQCAGQLE